MARLRDKTVHCTECHSNCTITANLDSGRVTLAIMPLTCKSPTKCLDDFAIGVFGRQFGAPILKASDW